MQLMKDKGLQPLVQPATRHLKRRLGNSFLDRLVPEGVGAIYSLRMVSKLGTRHKVKSFWA